MKETIIWTALPNGRSSNGKLQMSAHVTFHLSYTAQELSQAGGKAKVSNFTTVSGFKPESVAIKVLYNGKPVDAKIVSKPEPGLFGKFFPADGPVTSYDPVKPEWQEVRTFSTFDIYKHMEMIHADHIIASFEPTRSFAEQAISVNLMALTPHPDLKLNRAKKAQVRSTPRDPHAQMRAISEADTSYVGLKNILEARRTGQSVRGQTVSDLMVEAVHFHRPFLPITGEWALPKRPESDFHDALAMLCQHPNLMRMVGVVFDIEIDSLPTGDGLLSIQVDGMPVNSVRFPTTACVVSATGFMAKARTSVKGVTAYSSDIVQGFMRMNPEDVALGAMDLSGAVLQTSGFVDHTAIHANTPTPIRIGKSSSNGRPGPIRSSDPGAPGVAAASPEGDAAQLPARRTAGITVYRREHAAVHLVRDTIGQQIWTTRFVDTLYADDLHKGWRPDVQHNGKWFSLTARSVFYRIAGNSLSSDLVDEGHVSASNTASPDGKTVKIPESVLTWDGWSLSAPKPVSPLVDRSIQDDTMPNTSAISSIAEARSHTYAATETDTHYKLNYFAEPVKGSLPRLRFGEAYAVRSRSVDLAGNSLPITAKEPGGTSQTITYLRHEPILPPSVHLHDSAGPGESAYVVAVRKSGDGKVGGKALRFLYPPLGGFNMAELHGKFDLASGAPDPAFWDKVAAVDARKPLSEVIASVNAPPIPYLVDPACVGTAIKRTGRATKETDIATTGFLPGNAWIDALATTLSVMPGSAQKMEGSAGTQGLHLTLAPGQDITFSLSSTTSEEYLPVFEQTRWIEKSLQSRNDSLMNVVRNPMFNQRMERHRTHKPFNFEATIIRPIAIRVIREAPPESSAQKALDACLRGQNSALTPTRSVRVVYATQVPEPGFGFDKIVVTREERTSATFDLGGKVHGWSTEELEVTVAYKDPVDDINEHRRKTTTANHDAKITDLHPNYVDTVPINSWFAIEDIEFHDTKCHIVDVIAVAKTRYADFFPNVTHVPVAETRSRAGKFKVFLGNVISPTDGTVGDYTKTYITANIIVHATKRPDKPEIEYVLPAMTWAKESTPTGKVSRKRGNTIRIFLRRPWFTSGVGEKLAVVLPDGLGAHANDPDYHFNSTIGFDPAFQYTDQAMHLTADHFPGSVVKLGIPIAELGTTATLVTYDPIFDPGLQLWYVDVEIDPIAEYYTPFLRLVLCRYQPNAIKDYFTSALAVTEITQLQPDRIAVVQTDPARKHFSVYYAGTIGRTAKSENVVIGTLETQLPNSSDAPWIPVMQGNNPREFWVSNKMPDLNGISNLFEWGAHAENLTKMMGGRPPVIVTVPDAPGEYRVVLREYEIHPSLGGDPPVAINDPGIAGRLVHADVIYLTSDPVRPGGRPPPPQ